MTPEDGKVRFVNPNCVVSRLPAHRVVEVVGLTTFCAFAFSANDNAMTRMATDRANNPTDSTVSLKFFFQFLGMLMYFTKFSRISRYCRWIDRGDTSFLEIGLEPPSYRRIHSRTGNDGLEKFAFCFLRKVTDCRRCWWSVVASSLTNGNTRNKKIRKINFAQKSGRRAFPPRQPEDFSLRLTARR